MVSLFDQWIYVLFALLSPALSFTRGRRHSKYDEYSSLRSSSYNEENSVLVQPANSLVPKYDCKARIGNKKFVPFVPTETFNDISSFINYLEERKIICGKREVNHQAKVVKCMEQPPDGVICFSDGKFYKFSGPLRGLTTRVVSQMIRDAEEPDKSGITSNRGINTRINRVELNPSHAQEDLLKKSWKKRSFGLKYGPNGAKTYQEVVMQSHGLNYGPRVCYGFIAPEAAVERVHAPKSSTGSNNSSKDRISKIMSDGNKYGVRKKHLLRKRSQILTVACRPLYIPTAKPSINEGRIARCRLPCGVHNCVPMQTCPCVPPCKTPAPPRITCEPEVAICCTEVIPCPTRCPKYDMTDEPCPKFSDHPKCPFLTKPHCCTGPTTVIPDSSGCNKEKAALNNTSVGHNTSTAIPHVTTTLKMNGTAAKSGAANKTSTRSENQQESDLSRFGSRMMGLWPTFDLRKLLKSARYHNKENKVDPVHLADFITSS